MAYTQYNFDAGGWNKNNTHEGTGGSNNKISFYVINLLTNAQVTFRLFPEDVSEESQAQFDEVVPRGRSTPLYGYASSARSVSYTLDLHDDYLPDGILTTVNHLRSLVYPSYNGGSISPPKCLVRVGKNISFTGICTNVSVTWKKPMRDGYYIRAEVSLSFNEVTNNARGAAEVAKGDF